MNYDSDDDVSKSFEAAYAAIRERIARGGPPWRGQVKCMCEACIGWYGAQVMEMEGKGRGGGDKVLAPHSTPRLVTT